MKGLTYELLNDEGRTPLIYLNVDGTGDAAETLLFYGHFDKQPYGNGWDADKSPTDPKIIDGRLYGRGVSDDGYSVFSAMTALKAV